MSDNIFLRFKNLYLGIQSTFCYKNLLCGQKFKIYCITVVLEEIFVKSILILQIFVTTIGICR